jgi:hypothetical protein
VVTSRGVEVGDDVKEGIAEDVGNVVNCEVLYGCFGWAKKTVRR